MTSHVGRTESESTPSWSEPVRPPDGAPNVVVVLFDDVGFAQLGCFGSDIRTPTCDRLASHGVRYRQFHTTTYCAPSRACLLTGRNHHAVGMGKNPGQARGFRGYTGRIERQHGFLSEILRARGYATFALGKWHLAPEEELAAGSPRTHWPLGRGFDRFYGFLGGLTHQFYPDLVHDNHRVSPPRRPEEGYHLNEDLADRAIEFVSDLRAVDHDRPFFMYYCPSAGHEPHHVPHEWADRYAGQFDGGWDLWREQVFARQLDLGVVPDGTALSARPDSIPAWEHLSADARRLYARQMEVYAGFLEHTDHHIGRLVDFLDATGELDNTLLVVTSDNGACSRGGEHGRNGDIPELASLETGLRLLSDWGRPHTFPHYSRGWAWAGNTPLRRWKGLLHEGGVVCPLTVHWPRGVATRGEVRGQYIHIIDITPTVLDAVGIEPPPTIDGIAQSPIHGVNIASTFDDGDAPTNKTIQYYEMMGSRAIWSDGWKAVTEQDLGVELNEDVIAAQQWELYELAHDVSEDHDLSHDRPDVLRRLVERWWTEADRHAVLPLSARVGSDRSIGERPRSHVYYPRAAPTPTPLAVDVWNRSHRVVANLRVGDPGVEGVLVAHGDWLGGYVLYVDAGRLVYVHSFAGDAQRIGSDIALPVGAVAVTLEVQRVGDRSATAALAIDSRAVAQGQLACVVPRPPKWTSLSCGYDAGAPVCCDYAAPFPFTGTITSVVVEILTD